MLFDIEKKLKKYSLSADLCLLHDEHKDCCCISGLKLKSLFNFGNSEKISFEENMIFLLFKIKGVILISLV